MLPDYYLILGITRSATSQQIKDAYKSLAKKYHPDKNAGFALAEEKFKSINEAYQTLSNPNKKSDYDWRWRNQQTTTTQTTSNYSSNYDYNYRPHTAYKTGYTSDFKYGRHYSSTDNYQQTESESAFIKDFKANLKFRLFGIGIFILVALVALFLGALMNKYAAKEHIKAAEKYTLNKLYINAIKEYDNAIEFDDNNTEAYFGKAKIIVESTENYAKAILELNKAIEYSDTINPDYFVKRADCFYKNYQYQQAIYDLDVVLKEPKFRKGNLHYFRAMCNARLERREAACPDFQEAARLKFIPAEEKISDYCLQ